MTKIEKLEKRLGEIEELLLEIEDSLNDDEDIIDASSHGLWSDVKIIEDYIGQYNETRTSLRKLRSEMHDDIEESIDNLWEHVLEFENDPKQFILEMESL